ncbi:MAG: hypothetical protein PHS37_01215 [Candidatus Omnitrophica bacterium]|nr:hypothetical protein [Candidatus Omnitrophota bacterium]
MKKFVCLMVAVMFVIGLMPAFAAEGAKYQGDNLVKSVGDSLKDFKVRDQDKIKTAKTVPGFQNISNGIKDGAAKAKGLSLRRKAQ